LALAFVGVVTVAVPAMLHAGPPPPLSVYGKLPGVEHVVISPSGDHIAMVGEVDGVRRLLVIDQGKKSLISFPLEKAKIRGIYWAGDDRVLLYKSDTMKLTADFIADKAELASMIVIPLNGDKSWTVFANDPRIAGGVADFYGIQQRDGQYYGYFGALTTSGDFRSPDAYLTSGGPALYEVDLQSQRAKAIAPRFEARGFRDWTMAPGGAVGATLDYMSTTGGWVIRNSAGARIREGVNPLGRIELVGIGSTPDTVIYSEERKGEARRWFEIPLAGGEAKEILPDGSIDHAFFDGPTRQLIGYRQQGSVPAYSFFDARRQKIVNATLKAFPGLLVQLKDWNDRFDRLIVMTEGGDDPQTWWLVDIKTGQGAWLFLSDRQCRCRPGAGRQLQGRRRHAHRGRPDLAARPPAQEPASRDPAPWRPRGARLSRLRLVGPGIRVARLCGATA
jgi:hypothetical protein